MSANAPQSPEDQVRIELFQASARLVELGLNRGASGNCAIRLDSGKFMITPSGIPTEKLSAADMVKMSLTGDTLSAGKPSSEWRFHRDIFEQRLEINAIVHTHSSYATAFACLRQDLPAFHYMIAVAGGGSIRCAPYALFGSQALSDAAIDALQDRKACLLANHGVIATGANLQQAVALAVEVETLCQQYILALRAGAPCILSDKEMAEVLAQFEGYGVQNTTAEE